jgi:hypothetical protein
MVCNDYRADVVCHGNIVHNSLIYAGIWCSLFTVVFDLVIVMVKHNPSLAVRVTEM